MNIDLSTVTTVLTIIVSIIVVVKHIAGGYKNFVNKRKRKKLNRRILEGLPPP